MIPDDVRAAEIDETPLPRERPVPCALRLARAKAAAAPRAPGDVVLAADTIVAVGLRMLGKPADAREAAAFLRLLSGRRHRVVTAVAVATGETLRARAVQTILRFKPLSEPEIAAYVEGDEWRGKAGGYAIQGRAALFAPWMSGSYSAVVGLPLAETRAMLDAAGLS